jgi:hypothetical protein
MPFLSSVEMKGFTSSSLPKVRKTLTTPLLAGNSQAGIANDIFAINSITIKRVSVRPNASSSTATLRLYYKTGTIQTTYNTSGWTLASEVTGQTISSGVLYEFPEVTIDVPAGTSMSFFIYSNPNVSYTNGSAVGSTFASNVDIQIRSGYGTSNTIPPLTNVFQPRNFNGSITYDV